MVSYKGFGEKFLTFKNTKVQKGDLVAIKNDGVAEKANNSAKFVGLCVDDSHEGYITVQMSGYVELPYTGTMPDINYSAFTSNGNGGVKYENGGNIIFKVLKIDTEKNIVGFILKSDLKGGSKIMAFDNIKLDKGLYTGSKGFTASLEEIDPSANYAGTELDGLDAYQRQLKRFDIKVSGVNSDTVSKFFQTTDSAALFPEYVSRAVAQGVEYADEISKLVATTTTIDSLDYRSVESVPDDGDKELAVVGEGAFIPETRIKTKEKLTRLYKRGRMLTASYEAIKYQKLDLFTVTLKQIGAYIAKSQMNDLISCINSADIQTLQSENTELTYKDYVDLWASFNPYRLTNIIANTSEVAKMLDMSEFKDSNAGLNFHGTGSMITPFGANVTPCSLIDAGTVLALDNSAAVEKVQLGDIATEYDKLIDRQLERATITATAGFSVIFSDAIKAVTVKKA